MAPVLLRPLPEVSTRVERLGLSDGGQVDLAWRVDGDLSPDAPVLVVLPGLGGSIDSKYGRGLLLAAGARGWRAALLHFRGTSAVRPAEDRAFRAPMGSGSHRRSYHAGATEDPREVFFELRRRWPNAPLFAAGFSLGGNVLLSMLGEDGAATPVDRAAAASVPLMLAPCADRLERGFSRVYDRYLLQGLRAAHRPELTPGVDVRRLSSVRAFDDAVTAPLHGFSGADDYYARASARPRLRQIACPTLIVQARDDPFLTELVLPGPSELSPLVTLELSRTGGHVGFVAGEFFPFPRWRSRTRPEMGLRLSARFACEFWLERRLIEFLADGFPRGAADDSVWKRGGRGGVDSLNPVPRHGER